MSDFFDSSRIPDDAEYWDALAGRVAETALRGPNTSGFAWLTRSRAGMVAASLAFVAALAFLLLPTERAPSTSFSVASVQALAPADEAAQAIILRDQPPAIGALLLRSAEVAR